MERSHADNSDPYGLRSVTVDQLRRKYGTKWTANAPLFAAWVADMDFPPPPAVTDRLRTIIDRGELGYPPYFGDSHLSPAAMAFIERMRDRYSWTPDADRLVELNDVIQGVGAVVHHRSRPGDGVVLHMPAYYPFLNIIDSQSRRLVPVEWSDDGFDYEDLERRLEAETAKIWILCHPHNPLGHVFDEAELRRIADIAARHDLVVVSDEVHADLVYAPSRHLPFESITDYPLVVTVTSSSKAFNLAGLRWAIMHARDDATFESLTQFPIHYLGAVNTMAAEATVAAWTDGGPWLDSVLAQLAENRELVATLLEAHFPGADYRPPAATYLAWIDLRGARDGALGDTPAEVFREHRIEVSSGVQFGPSGVGHIRFNFATSPEVITATFEAMAATPS